METIGPGHRLYWPVITEKVPSEMVTRAVERAQREERISTVPHKFGYDMKRCVVGNIGEEVFVARFGGKIVGSYENDVILDEHTYEIKTIEAKDRPLNSYFATVNWPFADKPRKQNAEFYVFIRLQKTLWNVAWIVGWIPTADFWKDSREVRKGDELYPGKVARFNCNVLPVWRLNKFKDAE